MISKSSCYLKITTAERKMLQIGQDSSVYTPAKKLINIVSPYHAISLFFHLIFSLSLHCQLSLLIYTGPKTQQSLRNDQNFSAVRLVRD